jgi:hypothetical protein
MATTTMARPRGHEHQNNTNRGLPIITVLPIKAIQHYSGTMGMRCEA